MSYKVYKNLTGKVRVKHLCPHCNDPLENEIAEAGHQDKCPACGKQFIVPGNAEREKLEAKLRKDAIERKRLDAAALVEKRERAIQQEQAAEVEKLRRAEQARASAEEAARIAAQEELAKLKKRQEYVVVPENVNYPALDMYIVLLRVAGWVMIVGVAVYVGASLGYAFWGTDNASESRALIAAACVSILASIPAILAFFVGAQLLQLLLDARRDLAKLVAQGESKR